MKEYGDYSELHKEKEKARYINKKFDHDRSAFDSNLTAYSRVYLIADEIAKGATYKELAQKFCQEWSVSPNYIKSLVNEAIGLFQDEEYYKKIKDINNERLNNLYKQAVEQHDLRAAIKAIDTLNKTNGVYDQEKQTVQVALPDEQIIVTFGAPMPEVNIAQQVPTNVVDENEDDD